MILSEKESWLEARKKLVTASDVAAMLGENPYKTREQLRMEKAGLADSFEGNEGTDLALELEQWVLDRASNRWGWNTTRNQDLMIDSLQPLLGATPDAFFDSPWGRGIVQIKVTSSGTQDSIRPRKDGKPSTAAFANGAPLYYQIQVQAELAVTGLDHASLLVLHTGPLALRTYYIKRHEALIARVRSEVPAFWREVEALKG